MEEFHTVYFEGKGWVVVTLPRQTSFSPTLDSAKRNGLIRLGLVEENVEVWDDSETSCHYRTIRGYTPPPPDILGPWDNEDDEHKHQCWICKTWWHREEDEYECCYE